ncbi:hypothetical protein GS399_19325 [Pedobacter sp. HMF7647]|uniref:Putative auto-transporter adhesin head GIN domain-containing protein n=1 Tax=Hufsiella arboris TaxID=2695275 RepID=A0A7K1YEU2_9SPHI|nr:head GIN domain-containing protein [Hufsiella arboris]MXV53123.1 hypothetical protein [Hufsiella arboris]
MKLIYALIFVSVGLASCKDDGYHPCVNSSGGIRAENRATAQFTGVDLRLDGKLEISQGAQNVVVEANDSQVPYIRTRVENGILIIDSDRCLKGGNFKFSVQLDDLQSLNVSGSGDAIVNGNFKPENARFTISGSGDIKGSLDAKSLHAVISGSGGMDIHGNAENLDAEISGSGRIKAFGLLSNHVNSRISGSGDLECHATQSLNAQISGSGDVRYKGSPVIESHISGSGKVLNSN